MSARPSQQTNSFSLPPLQQKQRFTGKHGQMPGAFKDALAQFESTSTNSSNSAHSKANSNTNHSFPTISAAYSGKLVTGIANQTHSQTKTSHSSHAKG